LPITLTDRGVVTGLVARNAAAPDDRVPGAATLAKN